MIPITGNTINSIDVLNGVASSFLFGDLMITTLGKPMTYRVVGLIVLIIAGIAGANLLGAGTRVDNGAAARRKSSERLGNKLFIPALVIPVITVLLTLLGKDLMIGGVHFQDQKNLTLTSLALACIGEVIPTRLAAAITLRMPTSWARLTATVLTLCARASAKVTVP